MRTFGAIIIAAALAVGSAHAGEIRYTLSPLIEGGRLKVLAVEMVLTGEEDGETELALPDKWGGKSDLWHGIAELRVQGATSVATGGDPARRIIRHEPGATLTVRYRLLQFWAGDPDGSEYRPIIQPGYFHVIGWSAFVRPKWKLSTASVVSFKNFPKEWGFASDLEHGTLTLRKVLQSVTVGGDFRVSREGPLRVATRGSWAFSDEDFVRRLEPIIVSHRRFWGDPHDAFLVTVLPLPSKPNRRSFGGTGLGDSFAFYATGNMDVHDPQLTFGFAHEHLHTWIPLRVGATPEENDGIAESWFSEGFTDFYTYRLLVRDKLWSVEQTAKRLNEIMWAYAFSPARNIPNAKLAAEFWRDQNVQRMPYQRGLLIAALADDRLRKSGGVHDLDDVMIAMKHAADAAGVEARPPVRQAFTASMKAAGVDFADEIARFVEAGETVALPADIWAPCGVVESSDVAEFERGFKGARTKANGNIVTGVDPDGPAYAAGLRDGMRILDLELSGERDSRLPLTYRVVVNGEVREITYLPEGKRRETVQELKLRSLDEAGRKACAARFGGLE